MVHQRPAARLAAGQPAQPLLERWQLTVERVHHLQRDLDPLAVGGGQLEPSEERAPAGERNRLGTPRMPW